MVVPMYIYVVSPTMDPISMHVMIRGHKAEGYTFTRRVFDFFTAWKQACVIQKRQFSFLKKTMMMQATERINLPTKKDKISCANNQRSDNQSI